MSRYTKPSVPKGAWVEFEKRAEEINRDYQKLTGKNKRIPHTRIFSFMANRTLNPMYLSKEDIIALGKKRYFKR